MINTIIYTGDTGAGHTLAAKSLKEALNEKGHQATILNLFKESGKYFNKTITKGYQELVEKVPKIYKSFYKKYDNGTKASELVLKTVATKLKKDILKDISEYNPDVILSTQPIITNVLGRMKDEGLISQPIIAFVTDFKIHNVYIRDSIDAYVVGNEYTKQTMIDRGIDPEIVFDYGIPVREEFRKVTKEKEKSDEIRILIMAGSLGSKQLKKMLKAVLKSNTHFQITVVCGKNKRIKRVIEDLVRRHDRTDDVEILGFVDNISELMDRSDTIITKPGGLTSSEAIYKKIPIIIPYTYPGQEEDNAKYLVDNGMAIYTDNIRHLTQIVTDLNNNKNIIKDMQDNMGKLSESFSMDKTIELCEKLGQE